MTEPISQSTPMRALARGIAGLPARALIAMVRAYQWLLSPIFGGQCRFHPSCSQYFILAVEKYGAVSGSLRGIRRILRCHPWNPGGYDPP
jgi:putative membrane protein insertion efficiency factor